MTPACSHDNHVQVYDVRHRAVLPSLPLTLCLFQYVYQNWLDFVDASTEEMMEKVDDTIPWLPPKVSLQERNGCRVIAAL